MKKSKNIIGIIIYAIVAVLCFITIIVGYGEVSENLDGWHHFSSAHAMIFVAICLLMVVGCLFIIISMLKDNANAGVYVLGIVLIVIPLLFHIIAGALQGNVDTDMQYLMLRTFQGFDYTYIYLIVGSVLGYILLLCNKLKKKEGGKVA